jgi:hypothetical protein
MPSPYQQGSLGCTPLVSTRLSLWQHRTMSMNDPKTGWRVLAAGRISSLAGLHSAGLHARHSYTLRASGALPVRAALSVCRVNGLETRCRLSKEVWWEP